MGGRSGSLDDADGANFEFDYDHNTIVFNGRVIALTIREADVLKVLLNNRGRTTRMEMLIRQVYGAREPSTAAGSIRVAVTSLRKKLAETGIKIKSQHGLGYEIDAAQLPELNRRLSDKIRIALNLAEATGEEEIASQLRVTLELAERNRQRWLRKLGRGGQPSEAHRGP